jgi:nucleotide-binding universal stress UspA family protein
MNLSQRQPNLRLNAVIYGTDFSLCSESAAAYAALVAKQFLARLLVTHAFTPSQAAMEVEAKGVEPSQQRIDTKLLLKKKASALASEFVSAVPVLEDGDPGKLLPQLAQIHSPAMLVLGTHGGGWFERKFIGSVAEQVLRSTTCPTLTVGPKVIAAHPVAAFRRILCANYPDSSETGAVALAQGFAQSFAAELETSPAHAHILQHIEDRSIDLLVLGIEGSSLFGTDDPSSSDAFSLIIRASCPVLTIRQ